MEEEFPPHVQYWINASSKNDCFFIVGPVSGTTERIGSFKLILEAYSEPLRLMLSESQLAEKGDIVINDVDPITFRNFLNCVYGGTDIVINKLSFEECVHLIYVVEKYLVAEVKDKILTHMEQVLPQTFDNIFVSLSNPVCMLSIKLKKLIIEIIQTSTDKIFANDIFLQLPAEAVLFIVKQKILNVKEIDVWNAVIKWAKNKANTNDGETIRHLILEHLNFIRFYVMTSKEFCCNVIPENVLTIEEVQTICKAFTTQQFLIMEHICDNTKPRYKPIENTVSKSGIICHVIKDATAFQQEEIMYSKRIELSNFWWSIMVKKPHNSNYFGFFLQCEQSPRVKRSAWKCCAVADLILVNQCQKSNFQRSVRNEFNLFESDWGFHSFIEWERIVNPENGFIKNNDIIVLASFTVEPEGQS